MTDLIILIVYTIILATSTYIIILLSQWLTRRTLINKIPGPKSQYIIGNLLDYAGPLDKLFKTLRKFASQYKIYRSWLVFKYGVNLLVPEDIEIVIANTNHIEKSLLYYPLLRWLNTGLLTSGGSKWHSRRKILTPAFHFNILQQFVKVFVHHTNHLTQELQKTLSEPFVDVVPFVTRFTLHSICETAMGTRLDTKDKEQLRYINALYKMSESIVHIIFTPSQYYIVTAIFTRLFWRVRTVLKVLHGFSKRVIAERLKTFKESVSHKIGEDQFMSKKRLAMLDLLLSAKEDSGIIDDEGIREEVDTFMFEGHDTTAMSICFTLMLLANHQDIQDKVYHELEEVFGNDTRDPTYNDLQNLRYLEMCLKESLRLYPSVPLISRNLSTDIKTFSGYKILKDTPIVIHIYDMHHDPDIYPDPEKFDPNRFLPENTIKRHPFAYLPFSGGPRNCIGQRFALLELKTLVSGILRKYVLEAVDSPSSIILLQEIVIRSKNGIKIKFRLRNT